MSYILDALKKSEQERARGETPDVTTQHDLAPPGAEASPGRSRMVFWLVGGALCANAVLFTYWLFSDRSAADTQTMTAPPVAMPSAGDAPAPSSVTAAPQAVPPPPNPATDPQTPPAAASTPTPSPEAPSLQTSGALAAAEAPEEDAATESAAAAIEAASASVAQVDGDGATEAPGAPPATPSEPAPVAIRDLPDRIQRRIPNLEFATHIFGAAPRYREVTINGRRYAEGERVEGMLLSEITETGVVFDFEGYRFEMSVLADWDY